jgi:hypothetical protein
MTPSPLRDIVCGVLRKRPDPSNWSEYPNVWREVEQHVYHCDWYRVYDIVEAIRAELADRKRRFSKEFLLQIAIFDGEINTGAVTSHPAIS